MRKSIFKEEKSLNIALFLNNARSAQREEEVLTNLLHRREEYLIDIKEKSVIISPNPQLILDESKKAKRQRDIQIFEVAKQFIPIQSQFTEILIDSPKIQQRVKSDKPIEIWEVSFDVLRSLKKFAKDYKEDRPCPVKGLKKLYSKSENAQKKVEFIQNNWPFLSAELRDYVIWCVANKPVEKLQGFAVVYSAKTGAVAQIPVTTPGGGSAYDLVDLLMLEIPSIGQRIDPEDSSQHFGLEKIEGMQQELQENLDALARARKEAEEAEAAEAKKAQASQAARQVSLHELSSPTADEKNDKEKPDSITAKDFATQSDSERQGDRSSESESDSEGSTQSLGVLSTDADSASLSPFISALTAERKEESKHGEFKLDSPVQPEEDQPEISIIFPGGAKFNDAHFPAQFEFKTLAVAEAVRKKLADNTNITIDTADNQVWLKLNPQACKDGKVKALLDLFSYDNEEARRAASYLAHRGKDTRQYYNDQGCFGFLHRWMGESRENRCANAFNKINGTKTVKAAENIDKLDDDVHHFKDISRSCF